MHFDIFDPQDQPLLHLTLAAADVATLTVTGHTPIQPSAVLPEVAQLIHDLMQVDTS